MRLAISNIAWSLQVEESVLELLGNLGVDGIEVAPTVIWPQWEDVGREAARSQRGRMESLGFTIPALQAILYGTSGLDLFEEGEKREPLLSHIDLVAELASDLGAGVLVFGSPSHRAIAPRAADSAGRRARETLSEVGRICAARDVTFCIEPIPAAYGGEYLPRWRDVAQVVDELDTPGIGLHFDTACVALGGDDPVSAIGECAHLIRHFHVSEPHLADFDNPSLPHAEIGQALSESGYDGWVSIEMRAGENVHSAIERAVTMVGEWYLS